MRAALQDYYDDDGLYARRWHTRRLTSTDDDAKGGTREEIISLSRDLRRKFGIAGHVLRKYGRYCVGSCEVDFQSGNPSWDEQAEAFWSNHCRLIDFAGRSDMRSLARIGLASTVGDGDCGFIKRLDNGLPQLQAIEADRIRDDNAFSNPIEKQPRYKQGVRVDKNGNAVAYRVWDRDGGGGFKDPQEIPASAMILLVDPERFDGLRGLSHFSRGALNRLRDMKEITAAEIKSVKLSSKLALIVKKALGGQPRSAVNIFGTGVTGENGKEQAGEDIPDGMIKYLLPNEDAMAFESGRPHPNVLGFLEWLIREISISLDLPYSIVWSMSGLPGPAVRSEMKSAERTFSEKTDLIERVLLEPTCAWVTNWAMQNGRLPFNPNWFKFSFHRPPSLTIDVGRESAANLAEHLRGVLTGSEICQDRGKTFDATIRQKAREARTALDVAAEFNVPVEMVMNFATNVTASKSEAVQPDDQSNDNRPSES